MTADRTADRTTDRVEPEGYRRELYDVYLSAFKADGGRAAGRASFHRLLPRLEAAVDALGGAPRVLDVGCGGGQLLAELSRRRRLAQAVGIDLSAEQVAAARRLGVEAEVAEAAGYLESRVESFDLVTAIDLLEHLRKDELLRLVRAVSRALRPGGCLFVQTPNGEGLFAGGVIYGDLTHETILCPGSLVQLFRYAGLVDVSVAEVAPVGRARLAWRLLRWLAMSAKRVESGRTQRVWTHNMLGIGFRPSAGG